MRAQTKDETHNQRLMLGVTTMLLLLCYCLYALRILSRKLLKVGLWIDDWWMLFCLVILGVESHMTFH